LKISLDRCLNIWYTSNSGDGMTTIDKKNFAVAVKHYREKNDLTLEEFARKIPTTLNTIYRWESGKVVPKNQIVIDRLKELGVRI